MMTNLDLLPHPITDEGRARRCVAVAPGTTLAQMVDEVWRPGALAPIVWLDGQAVPPHAWAGTVLRGGEAVTIRSAVAGDDTDPLRTVLQIAVIVAAIYLPGSGLLFPALEGTAAALTSSAILIGGNLIVDAIAPPRLPDAGEAGAGPDPVHGLSGARNQARPYAALPLVLGTHRMAPDLGARQYTEYLTDDDGETHQYLNAIFNFGLGELAVSNVKIGDTLLATFDAEAVEYSTPAAIAGNVDTVAGGAVESQTAWITRTVARGADRVALDFIGTIFQINDDGDQVAHTVNLVIDYEVDGLSRAQDTLTALTGTDGTPVRVTHRRTLPVLDPAPSGQWTVRARRAAAPSDSDRIYDDVTWQALRSYQPDTASYDGQRRRGLRLRASGRLSGALDTVTALVSQQVPTWDATGGDDGTGAWTDNQATSNPAWIFRWFARGIRNAAGRLLAGAGLPETRIDDASLKAWGAWCAAEELGCNYVVQSAMSVHDVLALIAQCGRASPTWANGRLGVVWDAAGQVPVTLVTPGSVLAGSFEVDWAGGRQVDEVAVRYIDERTWESNVIRRVQDGVTLPTETATVTLRGVTSARQAAMECNLMLARQRYHRRRMRWRMDLGALNLLRRGDVVWVTHALLDGGEAGRLVRIDGAAVELDREITAVAGDHVLLALPDGRLHATTLADAAGASARVTLAEALPAPADGEPPFEPPDVLWRWYSAADPPAQARIVAMEPSVEDVRVTAIDEVAAYHDARLRDLADLPTSVASDPVRVVAIYPRTVALPASAGEVAQVRILIEVQGPWTGGRVVVNDASGAGDYEGQMGPADRQHIWTAPRTGALTIAVIPRGAPEGALRIPYQIDGPRPLPPPFDWRGDWAAGVSYERNDAVSYRGQSYICVTAHTAAASNAPTGTATANTWWDVLSRSGLRGDDGQGIEEIFAVTHRLTLSSSRRPVDSWAYDPETAHPLRGDVQWRDGADVSDLSTTSPILWRCARGVPGTPAGGTRPPADLPSDGWTGWGQPHIVGRYGADGTEGDAGVDGGGEERIYSLTGSGTDAIPAKWWPDPTWGFDEPTYRGPSSADRMLWYDAPPSTTATHPRRWISIRRVPGTPTQNDRPPSGLPAYPATKDGWSQWSTPAIDGDSKFGTPETVDNVVKYHQLGQLLICWGTHYYPDPPGGNPVATIGFPASPAYASPPSVIVQNVNPSSNPSHLTNAPAVSSITTTGFAARGAPSGWSWIAIGHTA